MLMMEKKKELCGRKKILTSEEEEKIIDAAEGDRDLTACDIANSSNLNKERVSDDKINRLLISNGYHARIKRKCQDFTP
jgi:hypothetical protein